MSNYYISENLIIQIFSWLPAKSLLQFKSVSKLWYKIIKSRYFISMHLKHNYVRRTNCFIAQFEVTRAGEVDSELLWHGESDESNTIRDYFSLQDDLNHSDFCGPCFGIYFLSDTWRGKKSLGRLWNPALYEMKNLPPIIMKPNISSNMECYVESYGFGFDPVTGDYKVVAIMGYLNLTVDDEYGYKTFSDYPLSIFIYSLRTDSWKYSRDLSRRFYIFHANSCYKFVNRSFYWLGSYERFPIKHDVIIAIDLVTEECQEIRLPDICIKESMTSNTYSECLMVYNGLIAFVALYNHKGTFDIWTLKGTTWSKELTMELDRSVCKAVGHYYVDNNLVLFTTYEGCLILCDPNTEETSELEAVFNGGICKMVSAYMESLVPLNDRDFWSHSDERPLVMP